MKRILHLDDESDIREVIRLYLQTLGYEVVSVATPTEALRELRRATPDLIISDLQLAESDGLDAVERIKAVAPNVPIIMLTGVLLTPRVAEETLHSRGLVYMEKTGSLQGLLKEIQRLIGA